MELWHPRAQQVIPADGHTGLSMLDVPPKIVLHTTETSNYSPSHGGYYGNPYWPHSTLVGYGTSLALAPMMAVHPSLTDDGTLHLNWDQWRQMLTGAHSQARSLGYGGTGTGTIYQHIPINAGAYALAHDAGTVDTNRANAIQCEIVWHAADANWPGDLLDLVADWVSWVQAQLDVPTVFAEMFREGVAVATVDSPIRFGEQEWVDFHGICGHSNVPGGNDHWDPGRLPVPRLAARLAPIPTPPTPPKEDDDMCMYRSVGSAWLLSGGKVFRIAGPSDLATIAAKVTDLGELSPEQHALFQASAGGK